MTRVVAALGGNALLRRGEPLEAARQRANVRRAVEALTGLATGAELVLTHGNGPQVGLLALQAAAYEAVTPYPLDVLGAESEGMIGYLLEQELENALPGRRVATLLTQVVVAPDDAAFGRPTKPIGPVYAETDARRLAAERGWTVARDGPAWRRVVSSPEPRAIVELETIRLLVEHGVLVVCTGGGGIPVVREHGLLRGVEAVIDKDLAAAVLARELGADLLLLLTDVPAVERGFGTRDALPIARATPAELRRERFAEGSMAPKVEAACRFVEATGGRAGIGALADAGRIARGDAGTLVVPDERRLATDRHKPPRGAVSSRA
ncbi:MAG TPA: carbamate kinase [Gaiellaceae bacterium]|nr:carbamate kinase [Gaiellaceae bacterium]